MPQQINLTHLDTIDWNKSALPVGVDVQGERPWLKLDEEDLRALKNLLSKPLPLVGLAEPLPPARTMSDGLNAFATWVDAALAWKQANPTK